MKNLRIYQQNDRIHIEKDGEPVVSLPSGNGNDLTIDVTSEPTVFTGDEIKKALEQLKYQHGLRRSPPLPHKSNERPEKYKTVEAKEILGIIHHEIKAPENEIIRFVEFEGENLIVEPWANWIFRNRCGEVIQSEKKPSVNSLGFVLGRKKSQKIMDSPESEDEYRRSWWTSLSRII